MGRNKTFLDDFLFRIKNNRVVAFLLLIGIVVIAVGKFTDATQRIRDFLIEAKPHSIAGKWRTSVLTNPYDKKTRSILFIEFIQQGEALSGTVTPMYVDEGRYGHTRVIMDGTLKKNAVTFHTQEEITDGTWNYEKQRFDPLARTMKVAYFGTLEKGNREIAFKRVDDSPRGGIPETFTARPEKRD